MRALRDRPDAFVHYGFRVAWVFGMIAILGGALGNRPPLQPFFLIAGMILTSIGIIAVTDYGGVLDGLSQRYRDSWHYRISGQGRFTRFQAALLLIVGLGWLGMGIATL